MIVYPVYLLEFKQIFHIFRYTTQILHLITKDLID